jgi:ABC-2 type transport system ATP-binding protein
MAENGRVVEIKNLVKEFPAVTAVNDVSFDIGEGEIYGLLGRNGAGKTTTMRILLDLVRPTSGGILLFGEQWQDAELRERIGYLPEFPVRYPHLTPVEYLQFSARLAGLDKKEAVKKCDDLIETVELTDSRKRRMRGFSKGMLQRVGLAQALINDPDLLLLDEPTAGLDPLGHRLVKNLVRDLAEDGKTVIISSHRLAEIEAECHRVAIIENGILITEGSIGDLLEVTNRVQLRAENMSEDTLSQLREISFSLTDARGTIRIDLTDEYGPGDIAKIVVENGATLLHLVAERMSLEDLFISLVGNVEEDGEGESKGGDA